MTKESNDNKDYRNYNEEKDRGFRGTFYMVISVTTLIVALVGATFSYFIATAQSEDGAVTAGSKMSALGFTMSDKSLSNPDLVPAKENVVLYSAVNQLMPDGDQYSEYLEALNSGATDIATKRDNLKKTRCRDDNGNAVCSLYRFTITNSTGSDSQNLKIKLGQSDNTFKNLYAIVREVPAADLSNDESSTKNSHTTKEDAGVKISEYHLEANDEEEVTNRKQDDNGGYYYELKDGLEITLNNNESKTYEIILYIKDTDADQTDVDALKNFVGTIIVEQDGESKIMGVISEATGQFES